MKCFNCGNEAPVIEMIIGYHKDDADEPCSYIGWNIADEVKDGLSVILITSAPERYDGFKTGTLEELDYVDRNQNRFRKVVIKKDHLEWHISRYTSGSYVTFTEEAFRGAQELRLTFYNKREEAVAQ